MASLVAAQRQLKRELITLRPQSHNTADSDVGKVGMVTKCLPFMQIGQMHFDTGNLCRQHGVSEGNTGVGESAKVNHHKGGPVGPGLLHPVDEYPSELLCKVSSS